MKLYYKGVLLHEAKFGDGEISHGNMSMKEHQIRTAKGIREAIDKGLLPTNIIELAEEVNEKKNFPINWENTYWDQFGDEGRPTAHKVGIRPGGLLDYIPPMLMWNFTTEEGPDE